MAMNKHFLAGMLMGLGLAACAGASFPYKYYGLDLKDQKLLGPTTADDLSLAASCDATATNQSPCVAMLSDAFLSLKQDYLDIQNQLNTCQQQLGVQSVQEHVH
jgi:hypothetical protein